MARIDSAVTLLFALTVVTTWSHPMTQKEADDRVERFSIVGVRKTRSSGRTPLLTPSMFPLPCTMAPSQLKVYLEGIVNSTLHAFEELDNEDDDDYAVAPGNAYSVVCAMTTRPSDLRREIMEFGRFPDKFFLDLPTDISPEDFLVVFRVWRQRLNIFSGFLDKMGIGAMHESISPTVDEDESRNNASSSSSSSSSSGFREFLRQASSSSPTPRGAIVESSESELRTWRIIVIAVVVAVIVVPIIYGLTQTARCALTSWKSENLSEEQVIE